MDIASGRWPWYLLLALATLAALVLRLPGLGAQIVIDDEWHALHKVLRAPMLDIVSHLDYADFSIPIAVYLRWLHDHGGITEIGMRLPMALAGCALVVVAPLLARPFAALPARSTWAVLLAVSPLLIYFSRTARPYALTVFLCTIALLAFPRWLAEASHRERWSTAYVAATVLSAWLHLVTLAFTLMPFVFFGVRALLLRDESLSRIVKLGVVTVVPLLIVLGPPLVNDWSMFVAKAGVDSVTPATALRSLLMLTGSAHAAVLAGMAACVAAGAVSMWRRDRTFVQYVFAVFAGGTLAIVGARPNWVMHPPVFARYLAPLLPIALLVAAEGLVAVSRVLWRPLRAPVVAGIGVVLFMAGPLPAQSYRPNQFTAHLRFQFDYDDAHNPYVRNLPAEPVPEFYRQLAQSPPGSLTLIEMPWRLESHFNPHVWYQALHRQNVMIGLVTPTCGTWNFGEYPEAESGMRLANMAHLSALLRGKTYGADYLVVRREPWRMPTDIEFEWPDVARCLPAIEAALGPPVFRDDRIVVFKLERKESAAVPKAPPR